MPGYSRNTQRSSQMRFTCPWPADKHHVMGTFSKVQVSQFANQALIDAGLREIEARQVTMQRKSCGLHLIADGPHRTVGTLCLQEMFD